MLSKQLSVRSDEFEQGIDRISVLQKQKYHSGTLFYIL